MRNPIPSTFSLFALVLPLLASCAPPQPAPSYQSRPPYHFDHFFPWPPPLASATEIIPRKLLVEKSRTMRLQDIDHKLTEAIKQHGYYESSYYPVPAGFALATRMERIEPDGTPKKEPQRWTLKDQPIATFSLAAYLKALLFASPGYYSTLAILGSESQWIQQDFPLVMAK